MRIHRVEANSRVSSVVTAKPATLDGRDVFVYLAVEELGKALMGRPAEGLVFLLTSLAGSRNNRISSVFGDRTRPGAESRVEMTG